MAYTEHIQTEMLKPYHSMKLWLAGQRMVEQKVPCVNSSGKVSEVGLLMNRLSLDYRAMVDASGQPVKLDTPVILHWPKGSTQDTEV